MDMCIYINKIIMRNLFGLKATKFYKNRPFATVNNTSKI